MCLGYILPEGSLTDFRLSIGWMNHIQTVLRQLDMESQFDKDISTSVRDRKEGFAGKKSFGACPFIHMGRALELCRCFFQSTD